MPSIGGLAFWSVSGDPDLPGMKVAPFMHQGLWGVAYRRTGRRANVFPLIARVDIVSGTTLHNSLVSQKALEGFVVSFTNDKGNNYNGYVVESVQRLSAVRLSNHDGGTLPAGTAGYLLTTQYLLRYPWGV